MELGSEARSFSTVAARLDVSPQALYSYFQNMDALRLAVAAQQLEHLSRPQAVHGDLAGFLLSSIIEFRRWLDANDLDLTAPLDSSFPLGLSSEPPATLVFKEQLEQFLEATAAEGIDPTTSMTLFVIVSDFVTSSRLIRFRESWWEDFDELLGNTEELKDGGFAQIASYRKMRESDSHGPTDPFMAAAQFLVKGMVAELHLVDSSAQSPSIAKDNRLQGSNGTARSLPHEGSVVEMIQPQPHCSTRSKLKNSS